MVEVVVVVIVAAVTAETGQQLQWTLCDHRKFLFCLCSVIRRLFFPSVEVDIFTVVVFELSIPDNY